MAQRARGRPLAVVDGRHELGLDEARLARRLAARERARGPRAGGEQPAEPRQLGLVEPGADAPRVAQLAVLVVADEQRSEPAGAVPRAGQPAADDHVGPPEVL